MDERIRIELTDEQACQIRNSICTLDPESRSEIFEMIESLLTTVRRMESEIYHTLSHRHALIDPNGMTLVDRINRLPIPDKGEAIVKVQVIYKPRKK